VTAIGPRTPPAEQASEGTPHRELSDVSFAASPLSSRLSGLPRPHFASGVRKLSVRFWQLSNWELVVEVLVGSALNAAIPCDKLPQH
jgi:hypothetical protein